MSRNIRRRMLVALAALVAAGLFAACSDGNDGGRDADVADRTETTDGDVAPDAPPDEATTETEDAPADLPEDVPADVPDDVPADAPEDDASSCIENVPAENDVLGSSGQFLPGMDAGTFCTSGRVTFTIDDVPADEVAALRTASREYSLVFALSDSGNRNYVQAMLVRQHDEDTSPLVLKVGGGTCIDCHCCACVDDPAMSDGWCSSEVYRPGCAPYDETAPSQTYTIHWDSDTHRIWYQRGSGELREFAKQIPVPFAFNKFCGAGHGCDMMHWGPPRWTTGTVNAAVDFECSRTVTTAPASCP
ncbi:MAG: hypothetical protein JXB32_12500 [Deltaproteobacteria bacterium]|nr:hypothetical protein [Deltaproteobacteria bacterium]